MKFKRINDRRISVYFSKEELQEKNINLGKMVESKQNLNLSVDNILFRISKETGINIEKSNYILEIIPLIMGDLLVSVLRKDKKLQSKVHKIVYKFDTFDSIFFVLNCFPEKIPVICDIYTYNGEYFLSMKKRGRFENKYLWILGEFGEKTPVNAIFLQEHGKCVVSKNGREIAGKYFG